MLKKIFKVINLISNKLKIRFGLLVFLSLISMFLEMFSLGIMIPLLNTVIGNDIGILNEILIKVNSTFLPNDSIVILLLILVIIIFLIKAIFLIYFSWYKANFSQKLFAKISNRLLESYLYRPYKYHTENNSSFMIKNITIEVGQFIYGSLNPLIILFTEISVFIGISLILFMHNPKAFLFTSLIFLFFAFLIFKFSRNKIANWGEIRHKFDGLRIRSINQSLNGIKPVILSNAENFFLNIHKKYIKETINAGIWVQVYSESPRYLFEVILIFVISSLFIFLYFINYEIYSIITTISLFGIASFKIIPSLNRALNQFQNITFNEVSSNTILEVLEYKNHIHNNNYKKKLDQKNSNIILENLSFFHLPNKKILSKVNIHFKDSNIVGIVGKSGVGKSTFVDILTGLIIPQEGGVFFNGENILNDIRSWRSKIGYVPQSVYLLDDSIENNILFGGPKNSDHKNHLKSIFEMCQLSETIDELKDKEKTLVGERGVRLSGGQIQRIGIARALYRKPIILILDESTSALDLKTEEEIYKLIYRLQGFKNIFIISHRLKSLNNCDLIYELKEGNFGEIKNEVKYFK